MVYRILVVEDNHTLLDSISFELEMNDYEVIRAENGQEAISLLEKLELPDLIVSDIAMPVMSGYEFLEAVRATDKWDHLPFIFLTAFDSKNAMLIGRNLGADDYLTKPFDPEELLAAVKNKIQRIEQMNSNTSRLLDEARQEFTNLVAHELRTPLTPILGGSEILEMSLKELPNDETHQYVQLIRSGAKRLQKSVKRIVMSVQLDSGRMPLLKGPMAEDVNLNDIVRQVGEKHTNDEFAKSFLIKLNLHSSPLVIHGMKNLFETIVDEIIDNAIKFSEVNREINIKTTVVDAYAKITVANKGRIIPKDQLKTVWGKFVQIDRGQYEQQGMGIGLYLVASLATAYGGRYEIMSDEDTGTQVSVYLPIKE